MTVTTFHQHQPTSTSAVPEAASAHVPAPISDLIEMADNPRLGVAGDISAGLQRYNASVIGPYKMHSFALYIRNTAGQVAGGIVAATYDDMCAIQLVWVDEPYRRMGVGSRLFARLFAYAREFGCRVAQLDTVEFHDSKEFYLKLGFVVRAEVPGGYHGATHFIMQKLL